jgi:50S ribosomal subunit-associated GTPase HflX
LHELARQAQRMWRRLFGPSKKEVTRDLCHARSRISHMERELNHYRRMEEEGRSHKWGMPWVVQKKASRDE